MDTSSWSPFWEKYGKADALWRDKRLATEEEARTDEGGCRDQEDVESQDVHGAGPSCR